MFKHCSRPNWYLAWVRELPTGGEVLEFIIQSEGDKYRSGFRERFIKLLREHVTPLRYVCLPIYHNYHKRAACRQKGFWEDVARVFMSHPFNVMDHIHTHINYTKIIFVQNFTVRSNLLRGMNIFFWALDACLIVQRLKRSCF